MTEELKTIIKEELAKTPREVGEVISNFNWEEISEKIGAKYLLNSDEITILQGEIALLLIGATKAYDFSAEIENNVETTKNISEKITDDIFREILNPISSKIEEKLKNKNTTLKNNTGFILSGGNQFSLMDWPEDKEATKKEEATTPQKITDLRSKFTI